MKSLLKAIVEDDRSRVRSLLRADDRLATRLLDEARLYESGIFHWLYVGDTALHLAAAGSRVGIVKLLLAEGADPNAASNHRRSGPLHYAADGYVIHPAWDPKRQAKTIECLVAAGAKVNAADKNGATPLHRAVRTRCALAVACLLSCGADPTARNRSGSTPFHLAVQTTGRGGSGAEVAKLAQRAIIEAFLDQGVRIKLTDGRGKSVADCAQSQWIRKLLIRCASDCETGA
jgi:hypothetical protein